MTRPTCANTTPDDAGTHTCRTDRLTLAANPVFAIDDHAAEATIVQRSAARLSPEAGNRCRRMRFETRWTVAGQNA
nr:hypothetical protein GCM10020063_082870 [Dactylosporangium thailandense]